MLIEIEQYQVPPSDGDKHTPSDGYSQNNSDLRYIRQP